MPPKFWEFAPPGYRLQQEIESLRRRRRNIFMPGDEETPPINPFETDLNAPENYPPPGGGGSTDWGEAPPSPFAGVRAFQAGAGPPGAPSPFRIPTPQEASTALEESPLTYAGLQLSRAETQELGSLFGKRDRSPEEMKRFSELAFGKPEEAIQRYWPSGFAVAGVKGVGGKALKLSGKGVKKAVPKPTFKVGDVVQVGDDVKPYTILQEVDKDTFVGRQGEGTVVAFDKRDVKPLPGQAAKAKAPLEQARAPQGDKEITLGAEDLFARPPKVSPLKGKTLTPVSSMGDPVGVKSMRVPLDEVEISHLPAVSPSLPEITSYWYKGKRIRRLTPEEQQVVANNPINAPLKADIQTPAPELAPKIEQVIEIVKKHIIDGRSSGLVFHGGPSGIKGNLIMGDATTDIYDAMRYAKNRKGEKGSVYIFTEKDWGKSPEKGIKPLLEIPIDDLREASGNLFPLSEFPFAWDKVPTADRLRFLKSVGLNEVIGIKTWDEIPLSKREILYNALRDRNINLPAPELAPPTKVAPSAVAPGQAAITPAPSPTGVSPISLPSPTGIPIAPSPPTTGVPPIPPAPPAPVPPVTPPIPPAVPGGISRSLERAKAMVEQNVASIWGKFNDLIPGLRQIRGYYAPGARMNPQTLTSWVAKSGVHAMETDKLALARASIINELETAFGKDAMQGGKVNIPFLGTPVEGRVKFTSTIFDIAGDPQLYNLSQAQKDALLHAQDAGIFNIDRINPEYGLEVGKFPVKSGALMLPNIDKSEVAMRLAKSERQAALSGRLEQRIWQTGRERLVHDPTFEPETNIYNLLWAKDQALANAAAEKTFLAGLGGKTLEEVMNEIHPGLAKKYWETTNPKPYTLVKEGVNRYFKVDDAKQIRTLLEVSNNKALNAMENLNQVNLSIDFSLLSSVQAPLNILSNPILAGKNFVKWLAGSRENPFSRNTVLDSMARNPQSWDDFGFTSGRAITGATPVEFRGGFLNRIPGYTKVNEGMFNFITLMNKSLFDSGVDKLEKLGIPHDIAVAASLDTATKAVPLVHPGLLGQSQARAALSRAPWISISYLTRPAELMNEAAKAYIKTARFQQLTPKEILARDWFTNIMVTSVSTGIFSYIMTRREGETIEDAVKEAISYNNIMTSRLPSGIRIPIAQQYRGLVKAIWPQEVSGIPFNMPFAGIPKWAMGKIRSSLKYPYDLVRNKDFYDNTIRSGDFTSQILQSLRYGAEQFSPLSGGQALAATRQRYSTSEVLQQVGTQFAGANVYPESAFASRDATVRRWAKEQNKPDIKGYNDLTTGDKLKFRAENPQVMEQMKQEITRRAEAGNAKAQEQKLQQVAYEKQVERDQWAQQGWRPHPQKPGERLKFTREDWRKQLHASKLEKAATTEYKKAIGKILEKDRNKLDTNNQALFDYYKMVEKQRDPALADGWLPDTSEKIDAFEANLTPKQLKFVKEHVHPGATPDQDRFYQDRIKMKEYWEVIDLAKSDWSKRIGMDIDKGLNELAIAESQKLLVAANKLKVQYGIQGYNNMLDYYKKLYLLRHPEAERLLIYWGYREIPISPENQRIRYEGMQRELAGAGAR